MWIESVRGSENITQLFQQREGYQHRAAAVARFIRYVNRCKIMPPYCRAQSDADVACTRTRMGRNERRRPDGQVKTHLSLRAGRLFRVRCNTGEKRPISSDINVVCMALTFSEEAYSQYDPIWNANACAPTKGKCRYFPRIIRLLLYAVIFIAITANRSSTRAVLPRVRHVWRQN